MNITKIDSIRSCTLLAAVFAFFAMSVARTRAQECFDPPMYVPGLGGPPKWFGAVGGTDWRPQLHDPRWASGPLQAFAGTSDLVSPTDDGLVRTIMYGNTLYVSFQAITDPNDISSTDAVHFGFTAGGNRAWAVSITPNPNSGDEVGAPHADVPKDDALPRTTGAFFINWYTHSDATSGADWSESHPSEQPAWLQDVATWTNSPGTVWAITFKVVFGLSGPAADVPPPTPPGTFKVFYGMEINQSATSDVQLGRKTLVPASDRLTSTTIPKDSDSWFEAKKEDGTCSTGLSISSSQVGVLDGVTLTNVIQGCSATGTPCPASGLTNTFQVNVHELPDPGSVLHAVRAKIRIADWGSTIADPNAPWKDIDGFPTDVFVRTQSQMTADSNFSWTYADSGGGVGVGTIEYECDAAANSYCPKLENIDEEDHQCMLVEIGSAPGQDYTLQNAAVYRNMNYTGLSSFSKTARITIEGLEKTTGVPKDRDLYIYVETANMPPHGNDRFALPLKEMTRAKAYAENPPPKLSIGEPKQAAQKARLAVVAQNNAAFDRVGLLDVPVMTSAQALTTYWPTYRIHVYYDTGETVTSKGQTRKVLKPMAPFGYYLYHSGPLYGFTHAIKGLDGVQLEEIEPNYYIVHVENEGSFKVKTTIKAEERPRSQESCRYCVCKPPEVNVNIRGCYCEMVGARSKSQSGWFWLLSLLPLLVLALHRRYRSLK